jgi:hypothetical protein
MQKSIEVAVKAAGKAGGDSFVLANRASSALTALIT